MISNLKVSKRSNGYDVTQICENGHIINNSSKSHPEFNADFCEQCGKETMTECDMCNRQIINFYHMEEVTSIHDGQLPDYCRSCGEPYPWTISKINMLKELTEVFKMSKANKTKFKKSISDIVTNTPRTQLASHIIKSILAELSSEYKISIKKIGMDLVCESAKKNNMGMRILSDLFSLD